MLELARRPMRKSWRSLCERHEWKAAYAGTKFPREISIESTLRSLVIDERGIRSRAALRHLSPPAGLHKRPSEGQVGQKLKRESEEARGRENCRVHGLQRGGETAADHWWTAKPGRLGGGEATRSTPQVGKARRRWRRRRRRRRYGGGSVADSGSGTGSDMKRRQKRAEEQAV